MVAELHRYTQLEAARVDYDGHDDGSESWPAPACFELQIVCVDGAVVRDGPEIDACMTVDTVAMGTVLYASQRRVATGVMRYHTTAEAGLEAQSIRHASRSLERPQLRRPRSGSLSGGGAASGSDTVVDGWISEHIRGRVDHPSKEPIAEVLDFFGRADPDDGE